MIPIGILDIGPLNDNMGGAHVIIVSTPVWVFVFFRLGQHLGSNLGTCLDGGSGFGLGLDKKKITKNEYKWKRDIEM